MAVPEITDWNFKPGSLCLGRFVDKGEYFPATYQMYVTRWIGFDKYEKFIFGLRNCKTKGDRELVIQPIFGGEAKVVRKLTFAENTENKEEKLAVSQCGEILAFVYITQILWLKKKNWFAFFIYFRSKMEF